MFVRGAEGACAALRYAWSPSSSGKVKVVGGAWASASLPRVAGKDF
jgi:hypothetical protein